MNASGRFALADPEGLLFSNDAISTTFARLDERLEPPRHVVQVDAVSGLELLLLDAPLELIRDAASTAVQYLAEE